MGEMNIADILSTISMISFIGAAVFFILALIFFVKFRIPSVISDLSGRTARKSIEMMRKNNEKTGSKSYKTSDTNKGRGKLTETMSNLNKNAVGENRQAETGILIEEDSTELLADPNETVLLQNPNILVEIETILLIHTDEVI